MFDIKLPKYWQKKVLYNFLVYGFARGRLAWFARQGCDGDVFVAVAVTVEIPGRKNNKIAKTV